MLSAVGEETWAVGRLYHVFGQFSVSSGGAAGSSIQITGMLQTYDPFSSGLLIGFVSSFSGGYSVAMEMSSGGTTANSITAVTSTNGHTYKYTFSYLTP